MQHVSDDSSRRCGGLSLYRTRRSSCRAIRQTYSLHLLISALNKTINSLRSTPRNSSSGQREEGGRSSQTKTAPLVRQTAFGWLLLRYPIPLQLPSLIQLKILFNFYFFYVCIILLASNLFITSCVVNKSRCKSVKEIII